MPAPVLVCPPMPFISSLRAAFGSDCAATAVIPIAIAETASTVRIIEHLPSLWAGGFRLSGQPRAQFDIPQKNTSRRAGRGSRSRELRTDVPENTRESAPVCRSHSAGYGAGAGFRRVAAPAIQ